MNEEDKRRHARVPLTVLLELHTPSGVVPKGKGFIVNLGIGGAALESDEQFDIGDNFVFRFSVPDGKNFDFLGEIRWIKKGVLTKKYGVKFKNINFFEKMRLKNFVLARLKSNK